MLDISDDEITRVFAPGIVREVQSNDPEWSKDVRRARYKALRDAFFVAIGRKKLSVQSSAEWYETKWSSNSVLSRMDLGSNDKKPGRVVWRKHLYYANNPAIKRVHLLYLMRLIEILNPTTVLEVGSGMGVNLLILANRFPTIRFTGVEPTENGHATAEQVKTWDALPDIAKNFSPLPLGSETAHNEIQFLRASAAALPFAKDAFDLTFTVQALEQMEAIRHQALSEIARVSKHTAMFEPFADFNKSLHHRIRVVSRDQFRGRISDLPSVGLEPLWSSDRMPSKLDYRIGVVLSRSSTTPTSASAIGAAGGQNVT